MSAEKIIYNLLSINAPLTTFVPATRIKDKIPLNAVLPSIAYSHISTIEDTSIGLVTTKSRSRIQVTVATKTYPEALSIIKLIKTACKNKQGTFGGFKTDSVLLEVAGSDFRDDEADIYYKTCDFKVTYNE